MDNRQACLNRARPVPPSLVVSQVCRSLVGPVVNPAGRLEPPNPGRTSQCQGELLQILAGSLREFTAYFTFCIQEVLMEMALVCDSVSRLQQVPNHCQRSGT